MSVVFVTGTDTDVGKTFAVGLLGRFLHQQGKSVITQKIAQTGCEKYSDDVKCHRQIMEMDWNTDDESGLTCPCTFRFPASPHLAARLENRTIDPRKITAATKKLAEKYDTVILEGVGGICVPLTPEITLLDYIAEQGYPVIIVTSAKLGSINHTLLTLEAIRRRNLDVLGMIYNRFPPQKEEIIQDSKRVFRSFLKKSGCPDIITDIPDMKEDTTELPDFSGLLNPVLHIYKAVLY